MRERRHRLLRIAALLGAVALVGAAAPDAPAGKPGKEVSPEKWVRSVCGSLDDWADALVEAQQNHDLQASDPEERQQAVVDYLGEVTDATNTLVRDLRKTGTPDVEDGKAIAKAFRRGFSQARDTFSDAGDAAEDLDPSDSDRFEEDVADIVATIESGATEIGETFDEADSRYDAPELDEAFEADPACSGIN